MLTYSDNDVKKYYENRYGKTQSFIPVGHHTIGRNLVYAVDDAKIFKVYFKSDKAINEMKTIPLLQKNNLLCPDILDTGQMPHGEDFILFTKIDGLVLDSIEKTLNPSELEMIYYKMGKILATLHTIEVPKYFEAWTLDADHQHSKSLKTMMIHNINRFYKRIHPENHENYPLIKRGYQCVMAHLDLLENNHEAVLSHHDFSKRNVMVIKNDVYDYYGLIDFEHTKPSDLDLEMVDTYLPLLEEDEHIAKIFLEGYTSVKAFNYERFEKKMHYYNIYIGIVICSWAKEKAYDFYLIGLEKIRKSLDAINQIASN